MIGLSKEGTNEPLLAQRGGFLIPERRRGMGKLSDKRCGEVLHAYFEEGLEAEEIARQMKLSPKSVLAVLSDKRLLEPYHTRSEAAKLREAELLQRICSN